MSDTQPTTGLPTISPAAKRMRAPASDAEISCVASGSSYAKPKSTGWCAQDSWNMAVALTKCPY
jgi:hypothetical protein